VDVDGVFYKGHRGNAGLTHRSGVFFLLVACGGASTPALFGLCRVRHGYTIGGVGRKAINL